MKLLVAKFFLRRRATDKRIIIFFKLLFSKKKGRLSAILFYKILVTDIILII